MSSMFKLNPIGRRKFLLGGAASLATLSIGALAEPVEASVHVVIAGSGAAGISIANRLARALKNGRITIIDRKETHYYWPGLTLVATGAWSKDKTLVENADFLPSNVTWIKEMVTEFKPDTKQVVTDIGQVVNYDFLVVATGVEYHYYAIEGMDTDAIGHHGLASVYHSPDAAARSWDVIKQFSQHGGTGIFTLPSTPIRCAGAPLKMAFLTLDRLKQNGGMDKAKLQFYSGTHSVFGLPWFNQFVLDRFSEAGMDVNFGTEVKAIDLNNRIVTLVDGDGNLSTQEYDLLHLVPPMRAPAAVRNSNLAWTEGNIAAGGWLAVDKETLQHVTYPEVFGCGDVNGTPRGKTAATVKMSVPIVVENLLATIAGKEPTATFNGYTSCPLLTKFGAAMLIEFDYNGDLVPTYPFIDPHKESWLAWVMKEQLLKPTYFQMLKGRV